MKWTLLVCATVLFATSATADHVPSQFTNQDGILNTSHNLTQSTINNPAVMDTFRNDYEEVCVYCHTPHGAATGLQVPLWNRTQTTATYTTYDQLDTTSLSGTVTAPGPNSLSCLSCHDGTIAVDSIINMPGSGRYDANQEFNENEAFLDSWTGNGSQNHQGLSDGECLACHSVGIADALNTVPFNIYAIGTDLRNDHPIGIDFPDTVANPDFKPFSATIPGKLAFYDGNADGRADKDEIRLYETGDGFEVECASCHDPHGVPSAGPGSLHQPSFLRVSNTQSALCQTCHNK